MKTILSLFLATLLFIGCKPIKETVYVDRWNDRYIQRVDSVYVNNTDTVLIEKRGDTVYNTMIKWRVRDKIRIERDTVQERKFFTIEKTITKTVKVRDLIWWGGLIVLITGVLYVGFKIYKKFFS